MMTAPTVIFRLARASDADSIATLVNSAYRGESSKRGWTTEAHLLDGKRTDAAEIAEKIANGSSEGFFVAHATLPESGGPTLTGCYYFRLENGVFYIGMLTVRPDLQALRIGRALLEHAEGYAPTVGCLRTRMTVIHVRAELIAYYERRGYARTGVEEPFQVEAKVEGLKLIEMEKRLFPR